MLTSKQKIFIGLVAVLLWLAAIVGIHFFPDVKEYLVTFIALCTATLVGLGVTHINESVASDNAKVPRAPSSQTGFTPLWMLGTLAVLAVGFASIMSGCTTTTASMYSGLYTQAKAGVQVFDDNSLKTMRDILCAQPYSAIQRHPEFQAGIVVLCGPLTNTASLNAEQLSLLAGLYNQLGLRPAAVPLPQVVPK